MIEAISHWVFTALLAAVAVLKFATVAAPWVRTDTRLRASKLMICVGAAGLALLCGWRLIDAGRLPVSPAAMLLQGLILLGIALIDVDQLFPHPSERA